MDQSEGEENRSDHRLFHKVKREKRIGCLSSGIVARETDPDIGGGKGELHVFIFSPS